MSIPGLQEMWKKEPPPVVFCLLSTPSLEMCCEIAFAEARQPQNAAAATAVTLITIAYYSKTLIESWSHCKWDLTCCFSVFLGTANKK